MCCLALASTALLCEAGATEGKCRAIFGTPYKERSIIEDDLGGLNPFYKFYEFVLPYKIIHKGVTPEEYVYETEEKSFFTSIDDDHINRKLEEWAKEKKNEIEEKAANCTCSQQQN